MVQSTGADVVRPAVAADDPHAAPEQIVIDATQVGDSRWVAVLEPPLQLAQAHTLRPQLGLPKLGRLEDLVHQLAPDHIAQLRQTPASQVGVAIGSQPQAESELGVVLEQRVRPRRAMPIGVDSPRRCGQISPVDGGTAGGVGDRQPVAEQL